MATNDQHTSNRGMIIALTVIAVVLAVVAAISITCMLTIFATPEVTDNPHQSTRAENIKSNVLLVDFNDQYAPANQPGCVRTTDARKVSYLPRALSKGEFYALWDCDLLDTNDNGNAHLLVTMREVYPVTGRVWTNWYDWDHWTGWKSVTPSSA